MKKISTLLPDISVRTKRTLVLTGALVSLCVGTSATAGSASTAAQDARIDKVFAEWDHNDSPGCRAFAFQDGDIILNKGYGMADLEWNQPIGPDTVFYLASTSKQFAAASIALLVLDGKLDMEDDVRKYIPELPDFGKTIRVKHLVHHTSGLRDLFGLKMIRGDLLPGLGGNQELVELMSHQTHLNFDPGTDWSYSNSGYVLMSVLVERVSGKTLAQFADERIFRPLGMTRTHFDDNHRKIVRERARSYIKGENGEWLRWVKVIDATGDGNLLSTVADLQRWDENFYNPKVGGKEFINLIQTPATGRVMGNAKYAFGLAVDDSYRGLNTVHHGGSFMGFRIQLMRFPDQHFSSGVLCNAGNVNSTELSYRIADIYLEDQLGPEEKKEDKKTDNNKNVASNMSSTDMGKFVGTYYSPELDVEANVDVKNGEMTISGTGILNGKLIPLAGGKLALEYANKRHPQAPDGDVVAVTGESGQVEALVMDLGGIKNFHMNKTR